MKLSEYIKKFGDKQVDVDKLSELIVEEDKVWLPKENENYYFVDYVGEVSRYFNDDILDKSIINYQQVYRTKAEAEFASDKAIFLEFMRKEFLKNSDVIDWEDVSQYKYYLLYFHNRGKIDFSFNQSIQVSHMHTTNIDWLKIFIDEHEDNIKKYYFGIEG